MPYKALLFLTFVNVLNYFDRYIVHSVEPLLKQEFGLSNQDSGLLVSAFVFGYFLFSPFFGIFGDRLDKRVLMAFGLLIWSIATGLSGLATSFAFFFCARVLVGVGEASFGTIAPGYLKEREADPARLNGLLSLFFVAIPCGAALGYALGGLIAHHSSWHNVFFLATIPGLLVVPVFFWLKKTESTRNTENRFQGSAFAGLRLIAQSPVLVLAIVGYVFNTFALNGVAAFVVRHGTSLGLTIDQASSRFGGILLLTGFVGTFGGGKIATRRARTAERPIASLLKFTACSTIIGAPFLAAAFLCSSVPLFLACCFIGELMLFAGVAPLNAVIVSKAPPGTESLTQGVTIFMINLFGSITAPVVIGRVADELSGASPAQNLALALQLTTVAMIVSAVVWFLGSKKEARSI